MANNNQEKKKSLLRAKTAEKLTEMLKDIDISAAKVKEGEYSARARITALFDQASFSEIGAYVNRSADPDEAAGVICGYGAINGRLVYAFAQDHNRMDGAFDQVSEKKISALYDMAIKNGAPIVGIFDSDGVCVYEGVKALASLGRTLKASAVADGIIPRIAIVPGVCGGTLGVLASGFDFVLTVKKHEKSGTDLYAVPPFISGEIHNPAAEGISALETEDEASLFSEARKLISFLPSNNADGTIYSSEEFAEYDRSPDISNVTGDDLAELLSDRKNHIRLYSAYAPELAAGFAFIGGMVCAYIINNKNEKDGTLTPAACRVIAGIQNFSDRFGIPLVAFVDCPGFCQNESDDPEYLRCASELAKSMLDSVNPKISVVTGRAYGPGFIFMASKSIGGDIAYATPDACISALSPEASVAFVWNDRIRAADLSSSREMLEREWKEKLSSPNEAALCGEIDDIIPPSEIRPKVISALLMLAGKSRTAALRRKKY